MQGIRSLHEHNETGFKEPSHCSNQIHEHTHMKLLLEGNNSGENTNRLVDEKEKKIEKSNKL